MCTPLLACTAAALLYRRSCNGLAVTPFCAPCTASVATNLDLVLQSTELSEVYSFLTAEPVGASSTVHFLAMADLGHTTLDSADEYDYDESDDLLNFDPEGTPERVC